ncbi:gliding motility lipoprotein GldB [Adhaeribacter arboris]|uniref:Gliding motility lipoprotein GldB n=1 Tax=Adhaeribacter arboris TaxID=2072846 RepID=A0A2T2YKJ7_9BACT|nr:gliding motility lipoprotein GldB [Adhaeribacter arboris]PSR56028.1 gliding motility lipoprotein GldB [Adhaeribacter arboris]
MYLIKRSQIFVFLSLLLAFSCQKKSCEMDPRIAAINLNLPIQRLEKDLYASKSKEDVQRFLQTNPVFDRKYLQVDPNRLDDNFINSLYGLVTNPQLNKFVTETEQTFGNLETQQRDLVTAFKHIKYYYPKTNLPRVQTFISGLLGPDLVVSDSLIVLGLDYFVGDKGSYRPKQPQYILYRYKPQNLIPAVMLQQSAKFNSTDLEDKRMMAQMIYYGKSYYFTQQVLPCTPDSTLIGFSDQQIADIRYNEGKIWAHLVEKNLLFETNHFKTGKYLEERPTVPEIDAKCPGRIGRWVGWQIVRKYMEENPTVTLPQLMAEKDAQKIFNNSHYKPKRRS